MVRRLDILFNKRRLKMIRTTININKTLLKRLKKAMYDLDLSKDEVIALQPPLFPSPGPSPEV
jgi:hypothetical protein